MALLEIKNAEKLVNLSKKYHYESVSDMLNDKCNELEWLLEAKVICKKEIYNEETQGNNS